MYIEDAIVMISIDIISAIKRVRSHKKKNKEKNT